MDTTVNEEVFPKKEDPKVTAHSQEVQRARDDAAIAAALEEPRYYDGKNYWHKNQTRWVSDPKDVMASDIANQFKLFKRIHVDHVLWKTRQDARIDGTFPFIHNKNEVIYNPDGAFLNIARSTLVAPAETDGPFPWLAEFFEKIWDPKFPEQKEVFFAWFRRLYESACEGDLQAGQALIIAGGVGLGKTLLSRKIVGAAVGGFTDAGSVLLGKTDFNKEAVEKAIWAVDDNRGGATWMKHSEFSNALKRFAANPQIPYHPKFKDSATVTWKGRIIVTCNLDTHSLSILPYMDDSINDKVMLFKLGEWKANFKNIEAVIAQELPFFLRWLLNYKMTIPWKSGERFGPASFHHPDLSIQSVIDSPGAFIESALPTVLKCSFANDDKLKQVWLPTVEVHRLFMLTDGIGQICGSTFKGSASFGRYLSNIGAPLILKSRRVSGNKQYLIDLEECSRRFRTEGIA